MTDVDLWQLIMLKLLREDEVVLHVFISLAKEKGKLGLNGSEIVEGV
jgi:hypothetical protein